MISKERHLAQDKLDRLSFMRDFRRIQPVLSMTMWELFLREEKLRKNLEALRKSEKQSKDGNSPS